MIVNPILYQQGTKLPELENPGTAADLLAGKQLVDQYGNPLTGTMPQKSAADLTTSGPSIIVPAGYYSEQASKSVATATHPKPTLSRSGGTVTAKHVQSAGYTEGGTTTETLTIPTQAGKTVTPSTSQQTAVASGRLTTGAVYVEGSSNLVASNIKAGINIFGVTGTLSSINKTTLIVSNLTSSTVALYYCNGQNIIHFSVSSSSSRSMEVVSPSIVYLFGPYSMSITISTGNNSLLYNDRGNAVVQVDGKTTITIG